MGGGKALSHALFLASKACLLSVQTLINFFSALCLLSLDHDYEHVHEELFPNIVFSYFLICF